MAHEFHAQHFKISFFLASLRVAPRRPPRKRDRIIIQNQVHEFDSRHRRALEEKNVAKKHV